MEQITIPNSKDLKDLIELTTNSIAYAINTLIKPIGLMIPAWVLVIFDPAFLQGWIALAGVLATTSGAVALTVYKVINARKKLERENLAAAQRLILEEESFRQKLQAEKEKHTLQQIHMLVENFNMTYQEAVAEIERQANI